ncbi:hypothetical protein MOQ_007209 [Trypanosoma cruzi marinkellei]|uniref:Uncharacterized protein n=1 Tax=Trypanosoma cruzi marinkellei TaxID=85056 RepID=K2MPK4_TRYCR|nr:hypothetical protein MOQ_007209 [Trypanosoma cruzi marinkellei]
MKNNLYFLFILFIFFLVTFVNFFFLSFFPFFSFFLHGCIWAACIRTRGQNCGAGITVWEGKGGEGKGGVSMGKMDFHTLDPRRKNPYEQQVVWEELDALRDTVASLRQRQEQQTAQWRVMSEEQQKHCTDLASIYQQLQELLLSSSDAEGKQQSGGVVTASQELLKSEICELLQNFKHHIERHTAETTRRLDGFQTCLEEIQKKMEQDNCRAARQEERLMQLEEQQRDMLRRISFVSTLDDLEQLRVTFKQQLHSQQEDTTATIQRHIASVDERCATHEVRCREEQVNFQRETHQSIEQATHLLHDRIEAFCCELKAHASSIDVKTSNLEEQTRCQMKEMLQTHFEKTCEQVREVHQELTSKHLQLVEDTMEAVEKIAHVSDDLPRRVSLLQDDITNIHDTLHRHGEILNEQCLQGSVQGAFDEVKDWLQDLECRVLSRGEFDEVLAGVDGKLAALKREFILYFPAKYPADQSIEGEGDSFVSTAAGGGGDGGGRQPSERESEKRGGHI